MGRVTLEAVGADRAETLSNLFQLYVHDFTDFWTERRVELQEDGRFQPIRRWRPTGPIRRVRPS